MTTSVQEAAPGSATTKVESAPRGIAWQDKLTLLAIGIVVVVVTIPRLRAFALRENELDALRMLRVLATEPLEAGQRERPHDLAAIASRDTRLQRRLEDLQILADGTLRRHGYYFDCLGGDGGAPMLRAWPCEYGRSGRAAFVWTPSTGVRGHPNEDGAFSGSDGAPTREDFAADGWLRMPRR